MPREIVLGNGAMTIALDRNLTVNDFFYPRVGLENHLAGHRLRTGVWTDGKFMWVGNGWQIGMKYLPETLVSKCVARILEFDVELEVNDAVHHFLSLYLRKMTVNNLNQSARPIRVFFAHDFHIYGEETGDTAMYEPDVKGLVHYKRKRYFLINGVSDQGEGVKQFATGYKESFGREGTWKDAEDGVLEGNPIAQGAVDSVMSFELEMKPKSARNIYYWIACGKSLSEVKDLDSRAKGIGVEQLLLETENYWSAWVNRQDLDLSILPRDIVRLFKTSLLIMRTHVDNGGAIIGSCDSDVLQFNRDTYSYVWPRDGAIIAMAFDMAGFPEVSRLFFQFCNSAVAEKGYFNHKYSPDGSVGSSWHPLIDSYGHPQLPIQEDETALVLYALWKHYQKYRDVEFIRRVYPRLVERVAQFLLEYRNLETALPKPSFDLWEEKMGTFTSTSAAVCAALNAAAAFAKVFYDRKRQEMLSLASSQLKEAILTHLYDKKLGRFLKAIYPDGTRDTTVDSSLAFLFMFETFEARNETVENTMNSIIKSLWVNSEIGGLARYEKDRYRQVTESFPGNPWFICTLWLAKWHIARATSPLELAKGLEFLSWAAKRAAQSGVLAEQLDPFTGTPVSVSPLIWSHAEFVTAVCQYLEKYKSFLSR